MAVYRGAENVKFGLSKLHNSPSNLNEHHQLFDQPIGSAGTRFHMDRIHCKATSRGLKSRLSILSMVLYTFHSRVRENGTLLGPYTPSVSLERKRKRT